MRRGVLEGGSIVKQVLAGDWRRDGLRSAIDIACGTVALVSACPARAELLVRHDLPYRIALTIA